MTLALDFVNEDASFAMFQEEMSKVLEACSVYYNKSISKICVGVSGGADSLALLLMIDKWSKINRKTVYCLTLDHQLRDESLEEAQFVGDICKKNTIHHVILTWNHNGLDIPHTKLENIAREARYKLITEFCQKHDVDAVLTGHHWNDQLETFEMRKEFNSSDCGLAGMSQVRSLANNLLLIRPLLHFSKKHLQDFVKQKGISWKEDPMNSQESFLRVGHRNRILSYNREQILDVSQQIISLGKQRNIIEAQAVSFIKQHCELTNYGYASINIDELQKQMIDVQCEVIKRIVWNVGGKKYAPLISPIPLTTNKAINTIGKCLIKKKKTRLYVFRENRQVPVVTVNNERQILWDNRFLIKFNALLKNIVIKSSSQCEDDKMPRDAFAGYPCVYQNDKNQRIIDKKNYDILFQNKVNLFDVFV